MVDTDENVEYDELEPGHCIGNFSARAKACKVCLSRDECKTETEEAKKQAQEDAKQQ